MDEWLATNRAMWDVRAPAHAASAYYDVAAVAAGRDDLRLWEDSEVGPVAGRDDAVAAVRGRQFDVVL